MQFQNGGNKTHGSSDTSSGICHIAQNPPADGGKAHFVCLKGRRTLEPVAGNIQAQRRRRAADFHFDGNVIAGNYAITEFLEEVNPDVRLIGGDARQKAEIRRLTEWFDLKFEREVGRSLINEKVFKRFGKGLAPDSKVLKTALNNLNFHMEYIDWLCESRNYLAGSSFRWPTSPPPLIFRSSTIWGTCRGKATKTPGCGIRKSSPAPLSKTF